MGFLSGLTTALGVVNPVGLIGTVGAGLLSGAGEVYSAAQANKANKEQAESQMSFSADQARQQMAFQERMSSTAHQREVADLRAAGLNPLLSANSGASSPGGAAGSPAGYTAEALPLGRLLASARDNIQFHKEMKLLDAQKDNVEADTNKKVYDSGTASESQRGLWLENQLLDRRNRFFEKYPSLFKLHVMQGGLNSASSMLRLLK